jgi:hypothetical protein
LITRVGTMKPKLLLAAILIGILLILPACSLLGPTISQAEVYRIYTSVAQTYAVEHPTPTPTAGTPSPTLATIYKTATRTSTYDYYSTCQYSSLVTAETIPDGTEVFTGEDFDKTWEFYNNGTCAWSTSFSLVFVYGKRMGGANVSLDDIVAPGEYIHVTVELTAPPSEGEYTGNWQLMDPYARLFGEIPSVAIAAVDEPTNQDCHSYAHPHQHTIIYTDIHPDANSIGYSFTNLNQYHDSDRYNSPNSNRYTCSHRYHCSITYSIPNLIHSERLSFVISSVGRNLSAQWQTNPL